MSDKSKINIPYRGALLYPMPISVLEHFFFLGGGGGGGGMRPGVSVGRGDG